MSEIRKEKQAEVSRVAGTKAQWQELDSEFQSMVRALHRQLFIPKELKQHLAQFEPDGSLSEQLLRHFEANGDFYVDGRGPWISLPLVDGETHSAGLSRSQILAGDPRLAVLILAAVIDYNLYQSEAPFARGWLARARRLRTSPEHGSRLRRWLRYPLD